MSVKWDGLKSLHRRAIKLVFPDTLVTTDQKLKEMRKSLQKQPEYKKGLFMYRVLNNEAPEYISNLFTHSLTLIQLSNLFTHSLTLFQL